MMSIRATPKRGVAACLPAGRLSLGVLDRPTPMGGEKAYIALGSNIGDREANIRKAVDMMEGVGDTRVLRVSRLIETEPSGGPAGQGKYLNGVAEIETQLEPLQLLNQLHQIEQALGRNRAVEQRNGPRTCDLDILLMGDAVVRSAVLTIPHPRMHERLFVLEPLNEIAPNVVHPILGKTAKQLLDEAKRQTVNPDCEGGDG